jgi:hypothetical protein
MASSARLQAAGAEARAGGVPAPPRQAAPAEPEAAAAAARTVHVGGLEGALEDEAALSALFGRFGAWRRAT